MPLQRGHERGDEHHGWSTRRRTGDRSPRIEPRGTTALDFDTHYTLANEGRAALIDVFVFLTDDAGFTTQIGRRLEAQ